MNDVLSAPLPVKILRTDRVITTHRAGSTSFVDDTVDRLENQGNNP